MLFFGIPRRVWNYLRDKDYFERSMTMQNTLQLTPEQEKQLNAALSKRFGPKFMVTREVADLIKSRLSQDLQKSGTLDPKILSKTIETLRDTLTKSGGRITKE